jgi:hypothetical protein
METRDNSAVTNTLYGDGALRSLENLFNWRITRATGVGRGDGRKLDRMPKNAGVILAPTPLAVDYDQVEQTATVLFNIHQNASGNATIDPSQTNFTFSGKEVLGLTMDRSADMYSGFSSFA